MMSSGMLRRLALVRTDVSEKPSAFFIRVTEAWDLALSRAIYDPRYFPFSPLLLLTILHSEFHSSFLSHLVFLRCVRRWLVAASVVPSSLILVTLMKEALCSPDTSVLKRATHPRRHHSSQYHNRLQHFLFPVLTPLYAVDTKFRPQVAVAQSV
jgi:hypothetical protein